MVTQTGDGTFEFQVFLPHAGRVEVVGDFTDWQRQPLKLERHGPGWWTAATRVPPGDHVFSYLVDGREWVPDYAAHGVTLMAQQRWLSRLIST
ncbi:MAG: hypothetical protein JNM07_00665 [Phycisphaerae bacterium]|nr:hypothetical protein [Phycisphaerae bacterium]